MVKRILGRTMKVRNRGLQMSIQTGSSSRLRDEMNLSFLPLGSRPDFRDERELLHSSDYL